MSAVRSLYSVAQYVPDAGRGEAANIGVVLFIPSERWLDFRFSRSLERVRQFFHPGRQELRRVELALESLNHRLQLARGEFVEEADLAQFAAARADFLRLTPPRLTMVQERHTDLENLYFELVGDREPVDQGMREAGPALPRRVAEVFGQLEAEGKIWRPGQITVPTLGKPLPVQAVFENGRRNYVRAEPLGPGKKHDARMAQLGFHGRLIYRHPIERRDGQLVVVSSDPTAEAAVEGRFRQVLSDFDVRFVPYGESDAFADEVAQTAHGQP